MAKRLRLLLKRVGIASSLTSSPSKGFKPGMRYSVTITNKLDILRFVNRIGSGHPKKMEKLNKIRKFYSNAKTFESIFQIAPKEAVELFRKLRIKYGVTPKKTGIHDIWRIEKFEKNVMKWVLKRGLAAIKQKAKNDKDFKRLETLLSDDFYIDPIAEIREVDTNSNYVYDLTVLDNHTFIPGGEFVVSNCSFHHQLCFTLGAEKLMGMEVPERAEYIRTIIAELERLHNHYLWLGLLAFEMGFDTLFHYIIRDREIVMELFEILCGNRVHYSINTIGGVRRDLDLEKAKKVEKDLDTLEERSRHYMKVFKTDPSILKRIRGIGVLPKKQARELNVVGPVARASGIDYDIRSLGYLKYPELRFRPVIEEGGDILSRTLVRIRETLESIRLVQNAVIEIPGGKIKVKAPLKAPEGETTSRVEALRGELFYYILSGSDHPHRVRIRTPTYANMHCLKQILLRQQIADVPVAVQSLDPCWACCDRMTIVDARTGRKRLVTKEELRHAD